MRWSHGRSSLTDATGRATWCASPGGVHMGQMAYPRWLAPPNRKGRPMRPPPPKMRNRPDDPCEGCSGFRSVALEWALERGTLCETQQSWE